MGKLALALFIIVLVLGEGNQATRNNTHSYSCSQNAEKKTSVEILVENCFGVSNVMNSIV
jgi:hypothetical protein